MEQLDPYFAEEASEILQTIEHTLLSLFDEGKTIEKVHTLLRGAHTIKGSAASLKLDTIKIIAHHLEDVFQALYAPELEIDSELSGLLLEGYECLRSPLSAMLSNTSYDEEVILDRVASVFAKLQNKLGDFFGREATIPSSEELGFDVVGSIFQDSVPEDLEQLQNVILDSDPEEIKQVLLSQANFFLSIAKSYTLPGLEEIAQSILTALESSPERVLEIGLAALENLQQAQSDILAGDRIKGGEVSLELQSFIPEKEPKQPEETISFVSENKAVTTEVIVEKEPEKEPETIRKFPSESDYSLVKIPEIKTLTNTHALAPIENSSPLDRIFNSIWTADLEDSQPLQSIDLSAPPKPEKKSPTATIRVAIELLDNLSHSIGELIIEESQNFLQSELLDRQTQHTLVQFFDCQKQIDKIREWSDKNLRSSRLKKRKKREKLKQQYSQSSLSLTEVHSQFDSLEMDTYSDLHLLLQNLSEKVAILGREIESIQANIQQSHLQSRKRKQILFSARENLFEARMVELGTVLNRFPRIVEQMVANHKKPAELKIIGSEVLIDKSISERLYEPLLHLVRNAYDHGLESVETRLENGKPETGTITIKASHQGNRTTVKISDDGGGLNWEKIRNKALKRNLITPDLIDKITEAELSEVLFEPGFSTADRVNDLSGRGVGLDLVRNQLEAIEGSISLQSKSGVGTTFTLQLPLNLTTARLLVCQCWGITYALLSKSIEQILLPNSQQIQTQKSPEGDWQTYLVWNDSERLIEIRPFADLFKYPYPIKKQNKSSSLSTFPLKGKNNLNPLLILKQDERIFCLQVDRVLFEQEIVIKTLAGKIDLPSYIQGYSVLGDGGLTLAIDPLELIAKNWDDRTSLTVASLAPAENFKALETSLKNTQLLTASKGSFNNIQPEKTVKQITILAIEDSVVQRRTLVDNLEKNGYHVLQAGNGQEGLNVLEKNPAINLIICDIEMPVMNGFDFLNQCRHNPNFSQIPVIMLTTRAGNKHRELAFALGAKAYQTKPFSEQNLLAAITQLSN